MYFNETRDISNLTFNAPSEYNKTEKNIKNYKYHNDKFEIKL